MRDGLSGLRCSHYCVRLFATAGLFFIPFVYAEPARPVAGSLVCPRRPLDPESFFRSIQGEMLEVADDLGHTRRLGIFVAKIIHAL